MGFTYLSLLSAYLLGLGTWGLASFIIAMVRACHHCKIPWWPWEPESFHAPDCPSLVIDPGAKSPLIDEQLTNLTVDAMTSRCMATARRVSGGVQAWEICGNRLPCSGDEHAKVQCRHGEWTGDREWSGWYDPETRVCRKCGETVEEPCDDCIGQDGCEVEPCHDFVKANTNADVAAEWLLLGMDKVGSFSLLCLDPDKMLGAADQYSGHEYPGEYEIDLVASSDVFERLVADGEIETRIAVGTKEKQCATCNELAVFEVLSVVLKMGEAVERSRLACRGHLAEHVPADTPSEIYPLEESTETPEDIPF